MSHEAIVATLLALATYATAVQNGSVKAAEVKSDAQKS